MAPSPLSSHLFANARLRVENEARSPDMGHSSTDAHWTNVSLAITGMAEDIRLVLVATRSNEDSSAPWDLGNNPSMLFEYISNDWRIVAYNEIDRFIHWHGCRGIGDYKIIFKNEGDTSRFLRAFIEGRERADELAAMDVDRLSQRRFAILQELCRVSEGHGDGRIEEGY